MCYGKCCFIKCKVKCGCFFELKCLKVYFNYENYCFFVYMYRDFDGKKCFVRCDFICRCLFFLKCLVNRYIGGYKGFCRLVFFIKIFMVRGVLCFVGIFVVVYWF